MQVGLISELDAVNKILAVAGDSPVQTLDDSYVQMKLARQILQRTLRRVLTAGWWFNEEESVSLIPDVNQLITLPVNAISARVVDDAGKIVQRGRSMYNRSERTYQFSEPITADLTLALEWDQLPNEVREYITDDACFQYNEDFFKDANQKQTLDDNRSRSFAILKAADTHERDINLLLNTRVSNIAFRNRRGGYGSSY